MCFDTLQHFELADNIQVSIPLRSLIVPVANMCALLLPLADTRGRRPLITVTGMQFGAAVLQRKAESDGHHVRNRTIRSPQGRIYGRRLGPVRRIAAATAPVTAGPPSVFPCCDSATCR